MRPDARRTSAFLAVLITLVVFAGLGTTAAAAGTAALWHLDETSGSVANDSSSHDNDGQSSNVTLGVSGAKGTAYGFNGTSSVIVVDSSGSLNPGSADFAMSAMVNFTTVPHTNGTAEDYDMLRKGVATTSGGSYKMEIVNVDGKARVYCVVIDSGRDKAKITSKGSYADGSWHTIRCALTGSTWSVTVDGTTRSTSASSIGSVSNSASLTIGAKSGGGDWYLGKLDEVQITIG
jgi:concanavalin A-like lectin/glucanase superfamily protein